MKDKYIRAVLKALSVPLRQKKEIRRDLEEAFASAQEHGETEAAVIERLGTPEEFALGLTGSPRRLPAFKSAICLLLPALLCLLTSAVSLMQKPSEEIIGGAVSMTGIVVAANGFSLTHLLFQIGLILLIASSVLFIRTILKRRRTK